MTKWIARFCLVSMLLLQADMAFAQQKLPTMPGACAPLNITDQVTPPDGSVAKTGEYSAAVVRCIEVSIKGAVVYLLEALSVYMAPVVTALCTLALIVFATRAMAGEQRLGAQTIGFALRMTLVCIFSYNLGNYGGAIYAILDDLLGLVTANTATCTPYPWCGIDHFLGKLLGFGKDQHGGKILLFNGIIGLLGGALFSSTLGILLFMVGITSLISIILFVFQIVYLYLSSILVIGFLIIISPIIIPFAIFRYGERYFKQWMNLLLSAILIPVMMFAFLWIFLDIFDDILAKIFTILGGNDNLKAYLNTNRPLLSWLMPTDPNTVQQLGALNEVRPAGVASQARMYIPPVQTFADPASRYSFDSNMANPQVVDFGPNDGPIKQRLVYEFISLWIFATLMKSMLDKIPDVANNIAGARSGITLGMSALQQTFSGFNDKLRSFGQTPNTQATAPRPPMNTTK